MWRVYLFPIEFQKSFYFFLMYHSFITGPPLPPIAVVTIVSYVSYQLLQLCGSVVRNSCNRVVWYYRICLYSPNKISLLAQFSIISFPDYQFLVSLVVRISACHVEGPGSIPGRGENFLRAWFIIIFASFKSLAVKFSKLWNGTIVFLCFHQN